MIDALLIAAAFNGFLIILAFSLDKRALEMQREIDGARVRSASLRASIKCAGRG